MKTRRKGWNVGLPSLFGTATMAELSALHAVCTLPPETSLGTHFYMKHGLLKSAKLWYMVCVHPFVCYTVIFNYTMLVVFRRDCEKRLLASSSCVCVWPFVQMEQLGSHWTDFHEIWLLNIFLISDEKIKVSLKPDKHNQVLYMKSYIHLWYLNELFLEWEVFE